MYKWFMKTVKWGMNWYFSDLEFKIRTIQRVNDYELVMRWSVEGTSRTSLAKIAIGSIFMKPSEFVEESVYEGNFRFRFDRNGQISEHVVDNILPAPKKLVMLNAISWWQKGKQGEFELNSSRFNQ
jgi:hypothetical protein